MSGKPKIQIENLTKVFYKKDSRVVALDRVSLSVSDGEFI